MDFFDALTALFTGVMSFLGLFSFQFNRRPKCNAEIRHWRGRICVLTIYCYGTGTSSLFNKVKVDGWVIAPAETKLAGGFEDPSDSDFGPYVEGEFLVPAVTSNPVVFKFFIKRLDSVSSSSIVRSTLVSSGIFKSCPMLTKTRKHIDRDIAK